MLTAKIARLLRAPVTTATPCEPTWEWTPSLREALEAYPKIRASRGWDERLWAALQDKRARRASWRGQIESFVETEIGGVAVWRVLGSSLAGAALPLCLTLLCCAGPPQSAPLPPIAGLQSLSLTERRFWEEAAWQTPSRTLASWVPLDPNFNF